MRFARRGLMLFAASTALAACATGERAPERSVGEPEAMSLLGEPLYAPTLPEDVLLQRSAQLNEAHRAYLAAPGAEGAAIWFGRRLAYLGRYHDAIEVYTEGLQRHPHSYRLLRHRGHRYISVRQLDDSIADLERAAVLIEGVPDAIEPDGQPNAQNIPRSTTHTNIHYHLGLAYYLTGQWEKSRRAYAKCLELSPNDDMRVAAAYWLYLNLRRLGLPRVAESVLEDIRPQMDVIENHTYHRLLLTYKGELDPSVVESGDEGDGVQDATLAYGLAVTYLLDGERGEAVRRFRAIVDGEAWAAFGHIAAEAELARMGN